MDQIKQRNRIKQIKNKETKETKENKENYGKKRIKHKGNYINQRKQIKHRKTNTN